MNQLTMLLGSAVLLAGLGGGAYGHEGSGKDAAEEKPVTLTGELVDTGCYVTSDGDAKGKGHAECATACMASGIPAGILPEGSKQPSDMLYLLTNPAVLAPYAAQTIKVEGVPHKEMHAIDVEKVYVKQGDSWKEIPLKDAHHAHDAMHH
jgi:hypothetical protein